MPVAEAPRKIPIGIEQQVKQELDKMEQLGIIKKVQQPTEWVSQMVVLKKPNN